MIYWTNVESISSFNGNSANYLILWEIGGDYIAPQTSDSFHFSYKIGADEIVSMVYSKLIGDTDETMPVALISKHKLLPQYFLYKIKDGKLTKSTRVSSDPTELYKYMERW